MKKLTIALLSLIAVFALSGCSEDNNPTAVSGAEKARPDERTTLVDVAVAVNAETGEFSTLIAAVLAAELDGVLSGVRPFTVFAPTDAAFEALGYDAESIVELDKETLTGILLYHVTNGKRAAASVVNAKQIRMLNMGFASISAGMLSISILSREVASSIKSMALSGKKRSVM